MIDDPEPEFGSDEERRHCLAYHWWGRVCDAAFELTEGITDGWQERYERTCQVILSKVFLDKYEEDGSTIVPTAMQICEWRRRPEANRKKLRKAFEEHKCDPVYYETANIDPQPFWGTDWCDDLDEQALEQVYESHGRQPAP